MYPYSTGTNMTTTLCISFVVVVLIDSCCMVVCIVLIDDEPRFRCNASDVVDRSCLDACLFSITEIGRAPAEYSTAISTSDTNKFISTTGRR